jgi:hypothetical protein
MNLNLNSNIKAETIYNATVKDELLRHSKAFKDKKPNQRTVVRYITPQQDVERLEAYEKYQGANQELQRRTNFSEYPTYEIGPAGEIIHIQYSVLVEENLVALQFTGKDKEQYFLFDKGIIDGMIDAKTMSTSPADLYNRLGNLFEVWNLKSKRWMTIEKTSIASYKLIVGKEARQVMEKAGRIYTPNDREEI